MTKHSGPIHHKHPKPETPDDSTMPESSNEGQKSNYESNYPNGAVSSSGEDGADALLPEPHDPTINQDDTYGPAPPRDQIRPPETDIAAKDHPADLEEVPASVATRSDNEEYLKHFSSPDEYRKWLKRTDKPGTIAKK